MWKEVLPIKSMLLDCVKRGDTPILPDRWGTPSFLTGGGYHHPSRSGWGTLSSLIGGGYPIQNLMGVPSSSRLDGDTPPPIRTGWEPPPPQEWMAFGQVMLRAVRHLRFPAGGLSCVFILLLELWLRNREHQPDSHCGHLLVLQVLKKWQKSHLPLRLTTNSRH